MATNVIPGAETFSFRGIDLHGHLQQLRSSDEQDIATQRVIKRDGAIKEGMGWKDRKFTATLCYVGPTFRAEVTALHAAIRVESEGILNHPIYGRVTARCARFDDDLDVVGASNSTTVTLEFVEAGLDASVLSVAAQGVPAKSQSVLDANASATVFSSVYASAAASISTLTAGSAVYSAAVLVAVQSGNQDASLSSVLAQVGVNSAAAIAAIQADLAASLDVDRFDAIAACDLVYATCLDLSDALVDSRPPANLYIVPAPVSFLVLSGQFYGVDGLTRAEELLLNNPSITTPHAIPAGTVLVMAAPTV